jgi:hypothetical protein
MPAAMRRPGLDHIHTNYQLHAMRLRLDLGMHGIHGLGPQNATLACGCRHVRHEAFHTGTPAQALKTNLQQPASVRWVVKMLPGFELAQPQPQPP